MVKIRPDQLKDAILKELKDYDFRIKWDMSEASKKRTREGARMLRKSHGTHNTGDYNKGWKVRKTYRGHIIHNTVRPSLTHLLEKGHYTINKKEWVVAQPHISIVEENVVVKFEKDVERILKDAGRG